LWLPFYGLARLLYGLLLRTWFELTLGVAGKRVIVVYSRSPHWQEFIESRWLPTVTPHATTVNWSDRSSWGWWPSVSIQLFRFHAGSRDFNPMVILLPKAGRVRLLRLHGAFNDLKHGRDAGVMQAQDELFRFCELLQT